MAQSFQQQLDELTARIKELEAQQDNDPEWRVDASRYCDRVVEYIREHKSWGTTRIMNGLIEKLEIRQSAVLGLLYALEQAQRIKWVHRTDRNGWDVLDD